MQIQTSKAQEPQAASTTHPADPTLQPVPSSNKAMGGSTKSVLEYLFLSVTTLIVLSIIIRRLRMLKQTNRPYSAFFGSDNNYPSAQARNRRHFSRTGIIPPLPGRPYPEPFIPGVPPAYIGRRTRRTRAADIDASGRRLATAELDHGGELGDKDALPAYESYGGPPKYFELEMQTRLFGSGSANRPPMEQSEQSATANRSDDIGIPLDSRPSPDARQESPRGTVDTPPNPPPSSDVDLRNPPATNYANCTTSP